MDAISSAEVSDSSGQRPEVCVERFRRFRYRSRRCSRRRRGVDSAAPEMLVIMVSVPVEAVSDWSEPFTVTTGSAATPRIVRVEVVSLPLRFRAAEIDADPWPREECQMIRAPDRSSVTVILCPEASV